MASGSSRGRRTGLGAKRTCKKRHPQRAAGGDYYIQHTDKDMVLLIPSELQESVTVVKRVRRSEGVSLPITTDCGWGSLMPHEIIYRVFQLVVDSEGAVPALCRLAQVCRLWRQVASSPDLWLRVSVSRCWIVPTKTDPPNIQNKVKRTIESVIRERLSQVGDFSLHHWNNHIPFVLQVDVNAVSRFLEIRGADLRCLYLSFSCQTNNIISLLARGSCPELRLLEVNRGMQERMREVHVSAEGLQTSCPKLEVLRLLNVVFSVKSKTPSYPETPGFTCLQELCLATSSFSLITDGVCKRLLRDCTQLRVLDLRGCYKVTPEGICDLPCTDVERLYLGMYCSDATVKPTLPSTGCALLTRRWCHSLQELDLTGQNFTECDLSQALGILSGAASNETLQSLNLTGTKVHAAAVRDLLLSCRALTHLDLTSCRNIPRGLRCVYRGLEDVCQCLKTLTSRMVEESRD
ncbi:F-box/LRR-repeat protein 6-like isoform X2 [Dendropsophus ebraccatus]|uniref:F-box/LRR-repeat protein 6-like isoform X2 n=1 Tax=Dendropsophus ebraccatus TaxID=150705 RepID=UPI0038310028